MILPFLHIVCKITLPICFIDWAFEERLLESKYSVYTEISEDIEMQNPNSVGRTGINHVEVVSLFY